MDTEKCSGHARRRFRSDPSTDSTNPDTFPVPPFELQPAEPQNPPKNTGWRLENLSILYPHLCSRNPYLQSVCAGVNGAAWNSMQWIKIGFAPVGRLRDGSAVGL